jgi:hypothetical protein
MDICSELLSEYQLRLHDRRVPLSVDRSADGLRKNILIEFLRPDFSHDLGLERWFWVVDAGITSYLFYFGSTGSQAEIFLLSISGRLNLQNRTHHQRHISR